MRKHSAFQRIARGFALAIPLAAALVVVPDSASAQYFGRNKVQYDDFEFRVLESDHFDWHYYPQEGEAVSDAVRMGERWYERLARTFQHEFERSKPVVLYADHPDFQQTNTLSGMLGESTGGVTESLKNRVIMPLTGSYWDTDHVLGHELVHAFQYNIAQSRRGGGIQGLVRLPLWLVEGMAEYFSVGRDDPLTAMWIRDAIRRDDLPTIEQLNSGRYFPYRFGQALWSYIGGTYGDDAVVQIYRRGLGVGFEGAIQGVLGMSTDTLSVRWRETVAEEYLPLLEGRDAPDESGRLLFGPDTDASSELNLAPALSPDGRFVAFLSQRDLFTVDLYLADVQTGEVIRKLSSAAADEHFDALRYTDSSGTWSPDSERFAFVVFADGDQEIVIFEAANGRQSDRLSFTGVGAISNPAWSPDGTRIAFSGSVGGISDLFVYDLEASALFRLTNDKYADMQPTWSPDGRTIAFTTDRGPETNFESLTYSRFQIALIDVQTRGIQVVPIFGNVKHINPQYSADGSTLYFISDQDGFSNVYGLSFDTGAITRHTNVATGVSGITYLSPAMSVAQDGTLAYSLFDEMQFHVYTSNVNRPAETVQVVDNAELQPGRRLPPVNPDRFSRVATYLADAQTGLVPSGTWEPETDSEEYSPKLSLDYVGSPTIGVGVGGYGGSYASGATSAFFSDMLGDKVLGVALMANGTFKDIGGQALYADLGDRWNWMANIGRIPYLIGGYTPPDVDERGVYYGIQRLRIYVSSAGGELQYPFTTTERVEFGLGVTRYSYDLELEKLYVNEVGQITGYTREQLPTPDPLNMVQGSVALVHDNSYFGFTSPIQGSRYRLAVERTQGTADFTTLTADFRRYFNPTRNLTVGFRVLHYGRYGIEPQESTRDGFTGLLNPTFLGYEFFIRGYAWESFTNAECQATATVENNCPPLNRLFGNKIGLANFEVRTPLLGVEQYGLLNFPFLPTELVLFADVGVAADSPRCTEFDPDTRECLGFVDEDLEFRWARSSSGRIPVVSTGVSARFNILGFMILEAYYAYPWQRPEKGWHWGFSIAPGW